MKKRILFIGTGGTIASEMSDEGLLPGVGASALLGLSLIHIWVKGEPSPGVPPLRAA